MLQLLLIDVMLVLPDSDGLGLRLYQFSQRILQAARDRNGSADRQIELREFFARAFRSRVDRSTRLVDHNDEDTERMLLDHGPHKGVRLARCRSVADCNSAHIVLLNQIEK